METESVQEGLTIERLEKETETIHNFTQDVKNLIPLLGSLEDELVQIKRSLLIARDIMGAYDL